MLLSLARCCPEKLFREAEEKTRADRAEPNGGSGFPQVIRMFPAQDRLEAFTYTPVLDDLRTDGEYAYRYEGLGFFVSPGRRRGNAPEV